MCDISGHLVHHVASSPLADHLPIWGVRTGPRDVDWRAADPATLIWVEALNSGTARLVMLPFESHGYEAMESTEQVLFEMLAWFDKYVKKAAPRTTAR